MNGPHGPSCTCAWSWNDGCTRRRNQEMTEALKDWQGRHATKTGRAVHATADGRSRCGFPLSADWETVGRGSIVSCDQCLRPGVPVEMRPSLRGTRYRNAQPGAVREWHGRRVGVMVDAAMAGDRVAAARAFRWLGVGEGMASVFVAMMQAGTPEA